MENIYDKENQAPNAGITPLQHIHELFQSFYTDLNNLQKWIRAGENELFLRQYFDLNPKNGYSIPIFDFIVFFKDSELTPESVLPYRYMRVLHLSEYVVKVLTQIRKYQNFHKKHEIVLKIWQQLVRVIGSTPAYTTFSGFPQNIVDHLNGLQQQRLNIIRGYVFKCQQKPQSKSEQLEYLQTILGLFLEIESEEERLIDQIVNAGGISPHLTHFGDASNAFNNPSNLNPTLSVDSRLRLLDFCRLWRSRYNNDSRIVVNTTEEQLEQRQLFCRSSNSISTFYDWYSKNVYEIQSILSLTEHLGSFVTLNNTRNAYNCTLGSVRNQINGRVFNFTANDFVSYFLPYIRHCITTLNRIASLQSQRHLSLFESFWDITFMAQTLNTIRHAVLQNPSLKSQAMKGKTKSSSVAANRRIANVLHMPLGGLNKKDSQIYQREDNAAIIAAAD